MIGKIAWKNINYRPLNAVLCISLLLFGVGIISLLLLIQHQFEQKFEQDLKNIDLVVGAKGSPLQLVLSAVYHLDAPTGNIKLSEARKIMDNPLVEVAIPLAYGDSYQGFRILGTTKDYLKKYDAQLEKGNLFSKSMEVTLGADVAKNTGVTVGTVFVGTHGDVKEGHLHENHPYQVVRILKKTNSVLDRLVLTNIESVWQVHSKEGDLEHDHSHDHDHSSGHKTKQVITEDSMEITAILMNYKSKMSVLKMPRIINEQTNMQAVLPALEINRLFYMLGVGATTLKLIAGGIMLMAGLSVFFVLYNRLQDRRHELAILRAVGYRPRQLFSLLMLEGLILAFFGYVLGWLLSRAGIYLINQHAESDFNIQFGPEWVPGEGWLLLLTFLIGLLAASLPAWRAMQMDVSTILSESRN